MIIRRVIHDDGNPFVELTESGAAFKPSPSIQRLSVVCFYGQFHFLSCRMQKALARLPKVFLEDIDSNQLLDSLLPFEYNSNPMHTDIIPFWPP